MTQTPACCGSCAPPAAAETPTRRPGSGAAWTAGAGLLIMAGVAAEWAGADLFARAVFLAAVALGGARPARRALASLRRGVLDIYVLMAIAVGGALVLGDFFEAASVVTLFAVAQWLESRTLERARAAIGALLRLAPQTAARRRDGREETVAVDQLAAGDLVVVRPGERVPVDGCVGAGRSDVNEAPMTGESLPVEKGPGAEVWAGTINGRGALDVVVTRAGRDTRLARIVHLVEEAQAQRAPLQTLVDRFARVYTPAVVALAAMVALLPPLLSGADAAVWGYKALVLLVVACPCALVIATPVSIVAALSAAARAGVLVKGGVHLERLARVGVVAFDKTGTLTHGAVGVSEVGAIAPWGEDDVLRLAAGVEARSEHAIARAIAAEARARSLDAPEVTAFQAVPGRGAEGVVGGRAVLVGSERFLADHRVAGPDASSSAGVLARRADGESVVYVAVDGRVAGCIAVADRHRADAAEAIAGLRRVGLTRIVMLTGDHEATARATAARLAIDDARAGLLPEDKHAAVRAMQREGAVVLMVGDGVNDAPALAAADVGVAMAGVGSGVALEAADVALTADDLRQLPFAITLARATVATIRANVGIALGLKLGFVALAVAGSATLWMAVLADTGASVLVVANAVRLARRR